MVKKIGFFFLIGLMVFPVFAQELRPRDGGQQRGPWGEAGSTLDFAKQMESRAHAFSEEQKAEIKLTEDERSFTVWWQPEGFDPQKDITLVSLHGHAGWATRDFQVWHPQLQKRRYAILAVQWWYGRSQESHGYAKPNDIYRWIDQELKRRGIKPGNVIFQGFSMGSANSYAVTYFDTRSPQPYFAVSISNAGPYQEDFPPNRLFLAKVHEKPFAGTRWIYYCSEKDEEQQNCCDRMQAGADGIEKMGGTTVQFFRDPGNSHGGFMHSEYADYALDLSEKIIAEK